MSTHVIFSHPEIEWHYNTLNIFCNIPRKNLIHYIIHFIFIAFWILLSNATHTHTTSQLLRTPDAFKTTIQSNQKIYLYVCTLIVFLYTIKISAILGLVSFPKASTLVSLSYIASNFSTVAFPKVICLEISYAFVADLAARFFYVIYAFLYFASLIPHITFSIVSQVTPLQTRQISLTRITFCFFSRAESWSDAFPVWFLYY